MRHNRHEQQEEKSHNTMATSATTPTQHNKKKTASFITNAEKKESDCRASSHASPQSTAEYKMP